FFSSRRRHTRFSRDWSSDVCSSDLATMDHLRQGIHLRGYAQKNPKQEYKREAFELFEQLLESIKHDTVRILSHVQVRREDPAERSEERRVGKEGSARGSRYE